MDVVKTVNPSPEADRNTTSIYESTLSQPEQNVNEKMRGQGGGLREPF